VPIIFTLVADPVGAGFVDSLARPGGNATGFVQYEYGLSGKWLELLKEIAPRVTRAAVLRDAAITAGVGLFPYLGIFAYMITQSRGMAERSSQQAQQAREELRHVVGFSAADEIEKLDRLKKSGSISDQEFARLRAKLVQ
jgi:hypothetical protein